MLRFPPARRSAAPARDCGVARLGLVLGLGAVVLVGGTSAALLAGAGNPLAPVTAGPSPRPAPPVPTIAVAGQSVSAASAAKVTWEQPLHLSVTDGTLKSVTAVGPLGDVTGTLSPAGWTGTGTLLPSSTYTLHAVVADRDGKTTTLDRTVITAPAATVLHPTLSPDLRTVGVGSPVILQLDHPVNGAQARAALLQQLQVTTEPAIEGAWHFYNSTEVHYRPQNYWAPGTKVHVVADLSHFRVPGTTMWGSNTPRTTNFTIGDSVVSTVDITAHTMSVARNGRVLRVLPVSTGRDIYPTKGGIHIVLSVQKEQLYDSSTVGIPTASPDGYYETLPFSMRISNAGAFVHANPATVRFQGRDNVSHGCVNLSLADAQWFYSVSTRGDIVNVIHAAVPPVLSDAGMADWNYSWSQWKAGNLG